MNLNDQRREIAREICRSYGITLPLEALHAFAAILQPLKLLRGHTLLAIGDTSNHIHYIERGMVLQHHTQDGHTVTDHISREGDMLISTESYFLRQPTRIAATMLEPGILYAIPRDQLHTLASHSFQLCQLIFSIHQRALILAQRQARTMRLTSAKERYLHTLRENPEIIRRAPLHHVASLLQMTPETLSRVRAQVAETEKIKETLSPGLPL